MTTLTELGEMLIEVDKGREIQRRDAYPEYTPGNDWETMHDPDTFDNEQYEYRLKPVPVKTYYRVYKINGELQVIPSEVPFSDKWSHIVRQGGDDVIHIHDFEIEE